MTHLFNCYLIINTLCTTVDYSIEDRVINIHCKKCDTFILDQAGNELIEDGILSQLVELLATDRAEKAAEIIAEMAKSEDNRITFIQQEVIVVRYFYLS